MAQGLSESLAGRFETPYFPHWTYPEMRTAFGWSLDWFVFYGGYPGAATLIGEPARWRRYVLDSLIETTVARDVLLLSRVDKPALLRRVFELACRYSGQVLAYNKMLGQLRDAGNTTTLAHYLDLPAQAGLVVGLRKYAGDEARRRSSSPKLQVLNTALMTATSGLTLEEAQADGEFWGRLVESAVGAYLVNTALADGGRVWYWRERHDEVDFVFQDGPRLIAVEVKSRRARRANRGLAAFRAAFNPTVGLLVGGDGPALETFLTAPLKRWVKAG